MPAFQDPKKLDAARKLYAAKQTSVDTICQTFKISSATFYHYVTPAAADDAK